MARKGDEARGKSVPGTSGARRRGFSDGAGAYGRPRGTAVRPPDPGQYGSDVSSTTITSEHSTVSYPFGP